MSCNDIGTSVKTLIGSTCTYVTKNIGSDRNRFAYVRAISQCYSICCENGDDLYKMREELTHFAHTAPKFLKKRWFSDENKYYMLAIRQCIDVVDSLLIRFVRGYCSNDSERLVRNIFEGSTDGHQIHARMERIGHIED